MMSDVKLDKIGQVAVNVTNLEAAISFYRDILGMKFLFQVPGMAFFDLNGIRLLVDNTTGWQHPSSILYYQVDEIQDAYQSLAPDGPAPGVNNRPGAQFRQLVEQSYESTVQGLRPAATRR